MKTLNKSILVATVAALFSTPSFALKGKGAVATGTTSPTAVIQSAKPATSTKSTNTVPMNPQKMEEASKAVQNLNQSAKGATALKVGNTAQGSADAAAAKVFGAFSEGQNTSNLNLYTEFKKAVKTVSDWKTVNIATLNKILQILEDNNQVPKNQGKLTDTEMDVLRNIVIKVAKLSPPMYDVTGGQNFSAEVSTIIDSVLDSAKIDRKELDDCVHQTKDAA